MANTRMIIAMGLSFIFAGLGLIYLGDIKKGAIILAIAVIFNVLYYFIDPIFGNVAFIALVYGLIATYEEAKA